MGRKGVRAGSSTPITPHPLILAESIAAPVSFTGKKFAFLNLSKIFDSDIDWNYDGHGKLWTYNLNYFDFLHQEVTDEKNALALIESYCNEGQLKDGIEPYPISLRGINWIKYFSYKKVQNPLFDKILFEHYLLLADNLEYHLMGNHLLENGFSLLVGAYYFKNERFYRKAKRIITEELNEQVLDDGAHFELSTMYHQILLFRLLDCINVVKNNLWKDEQLLQYLTGKATAMLGWLKAMSFANAEVPMVNDAAFGISPTTEMIVAYADRLGISSKESNLSSSGYRMIKAERWEMMIDAGNIGPDYIPGHAHSDTLSFVLQVDRKPLIVDLGTSTYESGATRLFERSTEAHNTVMVNNQQQSEVWASFRVGRRARIIHLEEKENRIAAAHDGYRNIGLTHQRIWTWDVSQIRIEDTVSGNNANVHKIAFLHFHPDVNLTLKGSEALAGTAKLQFEGHKSIRIAEYNFPTGFNSLREAKALEISFERELQTTIKL